jgi:(p)ppGpp synthase/HD superfamily hydrolase
VTAFSNCDSDIDLDLEVSKLLKSKYVCEQEDEEQELEANLVHLPEIPRLLPGRLTAAEVYSFLCDQDRCEYLSPQDCLALSSATQILVSKAPLAVLSFYYQWKAPCLENDVKGEKFLFEYTLVQSSMQTARDLLDLKLDVATVAAVMLCDVMHVPTQPGEILLQDSFRLEVESLLRQMRMLRNVNRAVPDLSDENAQAVRGELMVAVQGGPLASETGTDPRAMFVLLGSALTWLRSGALRPPDEQDSVAKEALQVYAPLAYAIGAGNYFTDLERLSYQRLFPGSMARLERWRKVVWHDAHMVCSMLCSQLNERIKEAPSLTGLFECVEVSGRVKTKTSTFRKILRSRKPVDSIKDIIALRVVITPDPSATSRLATFENRTVSPMYVETMVCALVYRQVRALWDEVSGRFKDFVTKPKSNGYQSLHTTVRMPDGRDVEIQIRTAQMHERATSGAAAHQNYRAKQLGGGLAALPAAEGTSPDLDAARQEQLLLPQSQAQTKDQR